MAKKKARVYRSDEQKAQMIRDAESFPSMNDYARSAGIDGNWFRRMRKYYLEAHPDLLSTPRQETLPAVRLPEIPPPSLFKAADEATKRKMLEAYDRLPIEAKAPWREKFQATQALLYYYRTRFGMAKNPSYARNTKKAPVASDPTQALLAEYKSLPSNRMSKSQFLKEHGLTHQQIWEAKNRGRSLANKVSRPKPAKSQRNGHEAAPIPAIAHISEIGFLPAVPSLDDAINAMEVKRDQLASFIEDLKRMRGGVR